MAQVNEGQCGLCKHFEIHQVEQILKTHQASPEVTEECSHPKNVPLNLIVTPISGCSEFEAASA
ncbi:hypothetical protein [Mucisphaera calidilacus]|uniref:Uncharacterized protein n=1 Tax=Mucisphaera calidilacus TaxID=2527982 RepID=A0A518BY17_9BACT|nr:hypothetical protein [Mucisphaera calidilacus]QDU71879.1 hypothetical protein Pan265_17370 [Mucisphaera calidilacus]